jgi:hypothetical protein
MNFSKVLVIAALGIFLTAVWFETYIFYGRRKTARNELQALQGRMTAAREDRGRLDREVEYLSHPANLEKELRARFNYRDVGEKLMILVPTASSSSSSSPSS